MSLWQQKSVSKQKHNSVGKEEEASPPGKYFLFTNKDPEVRLHGATETQRGHSTRGSPDQGQGRQATGIPHLVSLCCSCRFFTPETPGFEPQREPTESSYHKPRSFLSQRSILLSSRSPMSESKAWVPSPFSPEDRPCSSGGPREDSILPSRPFSGGPQWSLAGVRVTALCLHLHRASASCIYLHSHCLSETPDTSSSAVPGRAWTRGGSPS